MQSISLLITVYSVIINIDISHSQSINDYPCSFEILSVYHSGQPDGRYFAYNVSDIDCILGSPLVTGTIYTVFYSGCNCTRSVVLWTDNTSGDIGDGHGRINPVGSSAGGQWVAGQYIAFHGISPACGCTPTSAPTLPSLSPSNQPSSTPSTTPSMAPTPSPVVFGFKTSGNTFCNKAGSSDPFTTTYYKGNKIYQCTIIPVSSSTTYTCDSDDPSTFDCVNTDGKMRYGLQIDSQVLAPEAIDDMCVTSLSIEGVVIETDWARVGDDINTNSEGSYVPFRYFNLTDYILGLGSIPGNYRGLVFDNASVCTTASPTLSPTSPTFNPTFDPTADPTLEPTTPTTEPTVNPTTQPTTNPTPLTPFAHCTVSHPDGWYTGHSVDINNLIWYDLSGYNNHGFINSSLGMDVNSFLNGNPIVTGSTSTIIHFPVTLSTTEFTIFNMAKYVTGGTKARILQTSVGNNLFGFWNLQSGVAHINLEWITPQSDQFGENWVVSSIQRHLYRGNFQDRTIANPTNPGLEGSDNQLFINGISPALAGNPDPEKSDFQITEIIVFNDLLSLPEIICIEDYINQTYYGPTASPTSDPTTEPTVDPTNDPTTEPTTYAPTTEPTFNPTMNPTESPWIDALTLGQINNTYNGEWYDLGQAEFNRVFREESIYHILVRECSTCIPSHQYIYYRRYTDIDTYDVYNTMKIWVDANNILDNDFNLFSTLGDAINNTNRWTYCNYDDIDDAVGAFRDCGPNGAVGNQLTGDKDANAWNVHSQGMHDTKFRIYIWRPPTSDPTMDPTSDPTTEPTVVPTTDPTNDPTQDPTSDPTIDPTSDPTRDPTVDPTSDPTLDPTTEPTKDPTKDPTSDPTIDPTEDPTQDPTIDPTSDPTIDPTNDPTTNPTDNPSVDPTIDPTRDPTTDPTFEPTTDPTIDPTVDPTSDPTIFPTVYPTTEPTKDPTTEPTMDPSIDPTSIPTTQPTHIDYPSAAPIIPDDRFNVTINWLQPMSSNYFLSDPYGRFEAVVEIMVEDDNNLLGINEFCLDCFTWQYLDRDTETPIWTDIEYTDNPQISTFITSEDDIIINTLTMQSSRTLNAGYCADESDINRIFEPDSTYLLRLKVNNDGSDYIFSEDSDVTIIRTNTIPTIGYCQVENIGDLKPLDPFNLICDDNNGTEISLEYNSLIDNVLINREFVDNITSLTGPSPSGNASITILIRNRIYPTSITCYDIDAQFRTFEEIFNDPDVNLTEAEQVEIIESALNNVQNITKSISFADDPAAAVSLHSVVSDIYDSNLTTQEEARQIIDDMTNNIIQSSSTFDILRSGVTNTSSSDISNEISTMTSITSNAQIVDFETSEMLVETYLFDIFAATDSVSNVADNDALHTISGETQGLINNLESSLAPYTDVDPDTISTKEKAVINTLYESLIDYSALSASTALSQANVGESFAYGFVEYYEDGSIKNEKNVTATKFESNNDTSVKPGCGSSAQSIELPSTFVQEQEGVFDCTFISSTRNNFIPVESQNNTRKINSDIVSVNIFDANRRRRRLSDKVEHKSNECSPYLIKINLRNVTQSFSNQQLGENGNFPSCDFWSTQDSNWDTKGCFVYDIINDSSVLCGCTHLTTFSVSDDEILPEANILTELDWRNLTPANILKYPTVTVVYLSLFAVFLFLCWMNPRGSEIREKSIISFEDIIYEEFRKEKLWSDITGKEIKYISQYMPHQDGLGRGIKSIRQTSDDKKSLRQLQFALFKTYLRNEHTLLSVFQRTAGTNFSLRQRLGCFFMYLSSVMVATATFYGIEQSSPAQDVIASFVVSLIGTLPVLIVRKFFQKAKPIVVKSQYANTPTTPGGSAGEYDKYDTEIHFNKDVMIDAVSAELRKSYFDSNAHKLKALATLRKNIFESIYPLPHVFKKIAWIILVIWSAIACIAAIVYGLSFDMQYEQKLNEENANVADGLFDEPCWNNSLVLRTENILSQQEFADKQAELDEENGSSYAGSDSASWVLSIFQSLATSLILWQPLTTYIVTWLKVWAFTWGLPLAVGPGNIIKIFKRCCCGYEPVSTQLAAYQQSSEENNGSGGDGNGNLTKGRDEGMAFSNRPIDLLTFLSRDELLLSHKNSNDDNKNDMEKDKDIEMQMIIQQTTSFKYLNNITWTNS